MSSYEEQIPALATTEEDELIRRLPPLQHRPQLDIEELRETVVVFEALPTLTYPIISFTDLVHKLGGPNATVTILGVRARVVDMAERITASYFPIGSTDDFVAKVGELISRNRKKVANPAQEFNRIRRELRDLSFPIANRAALRAALGNTEIRFGHSTRTADQVVADVPDAYFPIQSEDDLKRKALRLMVKRPLLTPPEWLFGVRPSR
jgi:hypothetical protein